MRREGAAKSEGVALGLRDRGYRWTPQRNMVLAALQGHNGHISAEGIHSQIKDQYSRVHICTVYRTLELLKELGLVTRTDLGQGLSLYHYQEKGHHHHLICEKCGRVQELDEALLSPLKAALVHKHHFCADLSHLAVFGRCQECL